MGDDDTARRRIGPATRALCVAVRPPRRRLPTLQDAFEDEERSTDSEIENVLGVIGSVPPPKVCDAPVVPLPLAAPVPSSSKPVLSSSEAAPSSPEPPAVPPEREESGMQSRIAAPAARDVRATLAELAVALRKRPLVVVTAVCGSVAFVLALAAMFHVIR
jgi:hypothetical protein